MEVYTTQYLSPLGRIEVQGSAHFIHSISFLDEPAAVSPASPSRADAPSVLPDLLQDCLHQLNEYFQGKRRAFSLRLSQPGTEFQQRVWESLLSVPFGQTVSYREIAQVLGSPESVRAVGHANGRNQLAIIVPCHRIIGHDGKLIGYASGLWRKKWLLDHERKHTGNWQMTLF